MEHAEEADLRAEVSGIASDLKQGGGTGLEEQAVDHALVLKGEGCKFTWQGEDEVHVACGQQFLFARLEPAQTRVREQDLLMLPADPAAAALHKGRTGTANDIGHLQRRPVYALRLCSPDAVSVSASRGLAVALRWRCERCR